MGITLFGHSYLDEDAGAAVVTETPANESEITDRLLDRDQGALWTGALEEYLDDIFPIAMLYRLPSQHIIKVDLGSARAVSGVAIINHNLTGIAVSVKGDVVTPPLVTLATITADGSNILETFASATVRYLWITIPTLGVAPQIGELLVGLHREITDNPFHERAGHATVGNVGSTRSPAGVRFAAKRGIGRQRMPWGWTALQGADLASLRAAYADCDEGAKNLAVADEFGAVRWMSLSSDTLEPTPKAGALDLTDVSIVLEDAP